MRYHRLLLAAVVSTAVALVTVACSKSDSAPSASSCTLTLGAVTTAVSAAATSGTIPVTASAATCAWTATSSASFLTVSSGATGTGNGSVAYSIAANTGALRSASISIGSNVVNFSQSGALAPVGCTVALSSTTARVNSGGGTVNIDVTAASTCGWTASTTSPFLTASANASGNGTVAITATANGAATARTGTVTIGGQTVTVTQDAGVFASFNLFDPGQSTDAVNVCQFRSATSQQTTCTLRSTSFTGGTAPITITSWQVQYTYASVKNVNATSSSTSLAISDSCGLANGGATDEGVLQPLDVTLVVTDSLGNTSTARSGVGNQPKLFVQLFNCGK